MLTPLVVTVGGEEWRWLDGGNRSPGTLFVGAVLLVVYAARNRRVLMALAATLALPILVAVWPNWENTDSGTAPACGLTNFVEFPSVADGNSTKLMT